MRSSRFYLRKLDYLRTMPDPHEVVSVVGGLAFLHAITNRAVKLTLVDAAPEPVEYCKEILLLIQKCPSLCDFRESLAGRFKDEPHVHMESHGLENGHFYWQFDSGNLASGDHYQRLKANLARLAPIPKLHNLEEVDYASQLPIHVLASNCDSPLFSPSYSIVQRILETATSRVRYISWLWDLELNPNPDNKSYTDYRDL